jgi:hypothetical protein
VAHVLARTALTCCAPILGGGCASAGFARSYSGTGSLQTNDSSTVELAVHSVGLAHCAGNPYLTMLLIGDECRLEWWDGVFTPEDARPCRLAFGNREHVLRVTDAVVQHPNAGRYVDTSVIDVRLGADDATTGTHLLYHVTGTETAGLPDWLSPQDPDGAPGVCPWRPHAEPAAWHSESEPERH